MLSGSLGADALAAITTLGFTFMALDCFDALLNWTNEHSYVKAIVTGSSDGTFTDEQLAATVIQRYFESNPDLLPTAQGRRFFTYVGFQERAIVKISPPFSPHCESFAIGTVHPTRAAKRRRNQARRAIEGSSRARWWICKVMCPACFL